MTDNSEIADGSSSDIDVDYIDVGEANRSTDCYTDEYVESAETDGGQPINTDSHAAFTDEATDGTVDLDAKPLETAWANEGVQRTTFYADGEDANGNPLPQTNGLGEDLGARRKRMWSYNSGFCRSDRSDVGRADMESRRTREITEAIASQCGLSEFEKEEAVEEALSIDGRRWTWAGGRTAVALVGIVRTVANSPEEALNPDYDAEPPYRDDYKCTDEYMVNPVQSDHFERVATDVCGTTVERIVRKAFEYVKE